MTVAISFQTLHLPPPFAYAYTLRLEATNEGLSVVFQHEYLHRDQITAEEVAEEGFSEEADFTWQGLLPNVWSEVIREVLSETKVTDDRPDDEFLDNYLFLEALGEISLKGYPEGAASWQYTMEELIQAIYEVSEKEKPLQLRLLAPAQKLEIKIEASFATRQLTVTKNGQKQMRAWELLSTLLGGLENMDLPPEGKAAPQKKGTWLSFDEEAFFKLKEDQAKELLRILD